MRIVSAQAIPLKQIQETMLEEINWANEQEESLFSRYYPRDYQANDVDNRRQGTHWNEIEKLSAQARHENHRYPRLPYIFRRFLKNQMLINQNVLKIQKHLADSIQLTEKKAHLLINLPQYLEQAAIQKLIKDQNIRLQGLHNSVDELNALNPHGDSVVERKINRKQIKLNRKNLDAMSALAGIVKQLMVKLNEVEGTIPISEKVNLHQLPEESTTDTQQYQLKENENYLKTQNTLPFIEKFNRNQYQINQNTLEANRLLIESHQSILDQFNR